jgi:hypothetical protein
MRNTHHERKFELLIAREMNWLDADAATARERPRDRV